MMLQKMIMSKGKRKKGSSQLSQFRKAYTAQRKVSFGAANKKKKESLARHKQEIGKREGTATQKRKVVAERRKSETKRLADWRKIFPPGSKVKEISRLKALIARLKREPF